MHVKRDSTDSFWMMLHENRRNSSHLAALKYSRNKNGKELFVDSHNKCEKSIFGIHAEIVTAEDFFDAVTVFLCKFDEVYAC